MHVVKDNFNRPTVHIHTDLCFLQELSLKDLISPPTIVEESRTTVIPICPVSLFIVYRASAMCALCANHK